MPSSAMSGGLKPTDIIGSTIVHGVWPDDTSIETIDAIVDTYRTESSKRSLEADNVDQARSVIRHSMVGNDFEPMHEKLAQLAHDQQLLAEDAASIAHTASRMAEECRGVQQAQLAVVDYWRPIIEELCMLGTFDGQMQAAVYLAQAKAKALALATDAAGNISAWGTRLLSTMATVTPVSLGSASAPPAPSTPSPGNGVQAVDYTTPKQDGGGGAGMQSSAGRVADTSDPESSEASSQPADNEKGHGRRADDSTDEKADSADGKDDTAKVTAHGSVSTETKDIAGSGISSPASAVAGTSGAGLGGGVPASSGLGGVGRAPASSLSSASMPGSASDFGGVVPRSPVEPSLPSTGGGAGAGSGSSSGGSSAAPRLGGGVPPISAAPPPVPSGAPLSSTSAAPGGAGGFGSASSAAVQPMAHAPAAAASGGAPGGAGVPVAGGMMAAPPPVPPASPVGAAPTASPGLSQGSLAGGAAAPGAAAAAAGQGVSVMPAAFTGDVPKTLNRYAQMAVDAVKALAPAAATMRGLLVAAAVVTTEGGSPQVVITTNDGAGYLPEGFFLPPNMIHAFSDLDSAEFDTKWFGWADPAKILIDYVVMRSQTADPVQLLGLASTGVIGLDVRNRFIQAVPSVTAERDAKPLTADGGRNAHRLKVLAPPFYDAVHQASAAVRERAAVRATETVMRLPAAAGLRAADGPWQVMTSGRTLTDAEWAAFRERYEAARGSTGRRGRVSCRMPVPRRSELLIKTSFSRPARWRCCCCGGRRRISVLRTSCMRRTRRGLT